jgi:hypothetical protein
MKMRLFVFLVFAGLPLAAQDNRKFSIHVTKVDRTPYHADGDKMSHEIIAEANSKTTFFRLRCEDIVSPYENENWPCIDLESGHDYIVARAPGGGLCPEYDHATYRGHIACYTILVETEKRRPS